MRSFILAVLLLLYLASSMLAQTGNATLRGQVTDPSDAAVPGATVIVSGADGSVKTATSDQLGRYTVSGLTPGRYTIRIGVKGFNLFEKTGVALAPAQALTINAKLVVTTEKQEVTVTAEDQQAKISTDPANNMSAVVLRGDDLKALSDNPDDLQEDLQALAGPAAGPDGGQIYIDGFTGGRLPPKESIREVRINSNPFAAEYDRLGFGRIEILTKPGTDKFRGQGFFNFGDRDFNSRNPFATTQPPYQLRQFGGNLSGPLGKKASFFLDGEERDINENALVVASVLDSNLNITPFNTAVVTPIRRTTVSPRVDYQVTPNNTFTARYTFSNQSQDDQGVGQFNLASRGYNQKVREQTVQLIDNIVLNSRAINETRFQFIDTRTDQNGVSSTPAISVAGAFTSGGAPFSLNFTNIDQYELQNYTSMTRGTHQIKFGARLRGVTEDSQSTTNHNGTFIFEGGRLPELTAGNALVLDNNGQPVEQDLSSIQVYQQTQRLLQQGLTGAQVAALGYGPSQFTLTAGTPLSSVGQFDIGAFAQDDWRVRPNVTLSLGLRYEAQTNIHDHRDFAPRIGIAWAPGATSKTPRPKFVIRGGSGLFYTRFTQDLVLNAERFNGVTQQQYIVQNPTFYPNIPPLSTLAADQVAQAVYQIDPHLRAPYIWQSVIGVERQLPHNITVTVNYAGSRGEHMLLTRNINAPEGSAAGPRPYGDAAGNIYQYESAGIFRQNQLLTNVQARVSPKFMMFGFYAFGKAQSNTDGVGTFPSNQYNMQPDYGRAGFDARHRVFMGGVITGPLKLQLSPFIILTSPMPFNITAGRDLNGDSLFTDRPAFATNTALPSVVSTPFGIFDTNPQPGQTIIPRNYGQGFSMISVNARLSRTWSFGERAGGSAGPMGGPRGGGPPGGGPMMIGGPGMFGGAGNAKYTLTATIAARNVINHVNLGQPVGDLSSPFFGQATSTAGGFGPLAGGAAGNRRIEMQLRFTF